MRAFKLSQFKLGKEAHVKEREREKGISLASNFDFFFFFFLFLFTLWAIEHFFGFAPLANDNTIGKNTLAQPLMIVVNDDDGISHFDEN